MLEDTALYTIIRGAHSERECVCERERECVCVRVRVRIDDV